MPPKNVQSTDLDHIQAHVDDVLGTRAVVPGFGVALQCIATRGKRFLEDETKVTQCVLHRLGLLNVDRR